MQKRLTKQQLEDLKKSVDINCDACIDICDKLDKTFADPIIDTAIELLDENKKLKSNKALSGAVEILEDMADVADNNGSAYLYRRDTGRVREIVKGIRELLRGD